jgi:predicted Zn-dependent protease
MAMRRLPGVFVLVALTASVWAQAPKNKKDDPSQIGNRDVGKGINIYSIEREMALGKQLAEEVTRQSKVVDDPLLSEFVNRICQNLARSSDARVPITCRLIEGDAPNAFALPGGFIFVNTGLIKLADEEDEMAAAIAHEIAHVAARHMTKQATKSAIANAATIPISIILGGGWAGVAARQGAGMGVPAALLKFDRKDESEADYLGVQYMYAAGYDPTAAISIFEKLQSLQRKQPGLIDRVFSTHPMDKDRIEKTEQEIGKILPEKPEYVVSTSEYSDIRSRLLKQDERKRVTKQEQEDRPTLRRRDLIE